MNAAFKIFCVTLALVLAAPAFGKSASRTRLLTSPNPAKAGAKVLLQAEVDGRGNGPTGTVSFTDGAVALGSATLSRIGAGQATLAAGLNFTCAVSAAGGARCWGRNKYGQLGDRSTKDRLTPVDVWGLSSGVVAITASERYTCSLTTEGAVKCLGQNPFGNLGDGTTTRRSTPVGVSGLSSGVVAITAGEFHTCAVTGAGAVKCWGLNSYEGRLGDGTVYTRYEPVSVSGLSSGVVAIAAGTDHTCALTSAGAVKCWGWNYYGQLGDGTKTDRRTPVAVSGLSSGVVAIAAAGYHSCALTTAGAMKCWGGNMSSQLGDGTTTTRLTPVAVSGLSSGVVAITTGFAHSCALTSIGAAKCWGGNSQGSVGDGTTETRRTPVDVAGLSSGVAAISAGWGQTCAVTGGVAKCWGRNIYGELGDGTTTNRNVPTPVLRLTPVVRARARLSTRSLGLGAHVLQASFPGDAAHTPSSGSNAQTIVP